MKLTATRRPAISDVRLLVACIAATCIAYLTWWLQPYIVREMLDSFGTDPSRAGLALSAELIATSMTSIAVARLIATWSFRRIALTAASVAVAGAAISVGATSYNLLVLARILTGIGEGGVLMVSMSVLALMHSPDRAYAQVMFVSNLIGVALGSLTQALGYTVKGSSIVFPLMLLTFLGMYPLMLLLPGTPRSPRPEAGAAASHSPLMSIRVFFLLAAVVSVAAATNSLWSFYFALGQKAGMDATAVSRSIQYTVITTSLAATIPMILGTRFGRFFPLALCLFAQTAAIAVISTSHSILAFDVAAAVYTASGFLALPYYFGYAIAEDPSGRAATVVGAAYLLAAAVSPYLGGMMIEQFGLQSIAWLTAGASTFAGCVFFRLKTHSNQHVKVDQRATV
jgi:predicted MFS family arabinose efflux permease